MGCRSAAAGSCDLQCSAPHPLPGVGGGTDTHQRPPPFPPPPRREGSAQGAATQPGPQDPPVSLPRGLWVCSSRGGQTPPTPLPPAARLCSPRCSSHGCPPWGGSAGGLHVPPPSCTHSPHVCEQGVGGCRAQPGTCCARARSWQGVCSQGTRTPVPPGRCQARGVRGGGLGPPNALVSRATSWELCLVWLPGCEGCWDLTRNLPGLF